MIRIAPPVVRATSIPGVDHWGKAACPIAAMPTPPRIDKARARRGMAPFGL